jgi:DNA-binding Lrp family transcriptional regulator
MDEIDLKLLTILEKGITLSPFPFREIAEELKISETEILNRINQLREDQTIRRFGASIKPNGIGLTANALVAWKVPKQRIQDIGNYFSEIKEVSHCYERTSDNPNWTYNIYTVLHAQTRLIIEQIVNELQTKLHLEYKILYSIRDLKRSLKPKETM